VLYGGAGELHEFAVKYTGTAPTATVVSGTGTIKQAAANGAVAVQFVANGQTVVQVGTTLFYLVGMSSSF